MAKEYYIGDFLKRIKRPMKIDADQYYNLVTVRLYHKGVTLREVKKGSQIESNMYEVKEGDFILSGIDARNGAFGIIPKDLDGAVVTNDFWYFEIDEKIINKHLFLELTATSWFDDICKKGSDGTTQRIRLQKDKFFTQKIILPEIKDQPQILDKINNLRSNNTQFLKEVQNQQKLLTFLRQAILTEAVEGQLTAQWRKENPNQEHARELLKRIAAEKAQLIKEKKISKEKPLPEIKQEEVPYELPEGWMWCRLDRLVSILGDGIHGTPEYSINGAYYFINGNNLNKGKIEIKHNTKKVSESEFHKYKKNLTDRSILVSINGTLGNIAFYQGEKVILGKSACYFSLLPEVEKEFVKIIVESKHFLDYAFSSATGTTIKNVSLNSMRLFPVAIAPNKEQHAIVQKVNTLLAYCDELEQHVQQSKVDLDLLMQSVLSEVFGTENQTISNEPTKTNLSEKETQTVSEPRQTYERNTLNMELLEILQLQGGKIAAANLWQLSKYQKDIDAFYEALKKEVEEKKTIKESAEKGWLELVEK